MRETKIARIKGKVLINKQTGKRVDVTETIKKELKIDPKLPKKTKAVENINQLYKDYVNNRSERNSLKLFKEIRKNFIPYANKLISVYTKNSINREKIEADALLMETFYQIIRHNSVKEKEGKSLLEIDDDKNFNFTAWTKTIIRNELLKVLMHDKEYSKSKIYFSSLSNNSKADYEFEESDYLFNNVSKEDSYQDLYVSNGYEVAENENEMNKIYGKIIDGIYELKSDLKDILEDRELNKFSYKDISEKYNINIDTVKTRIFNARKQIKKNYTDDYKQYKSL